MELEDAKNRSENDKDNSNISEDESYDDDSDYKSEDIGNNESDSPDSVLIRSWVSSMILLHQ